MTAIKTSAYHATLALPAILCVVLSTSNANAQLYGIVDLGTLGGPTSDAFAINAAGNVAGASTLMDANVNGFYYDTAMNTIVPLAGTQCHAFDLNAADQVAAMSYSLGDLVTHGLRWQDGIPTNLGNIAPRGIDAAGDIVGHISLLDPNFGWVDHAAQWQNGNIYDLGTLGGHFSYAYAVADDGLIVGMSYSLNDADRRASVWQGGVPHDLGTLGGLNSQAYAINNLREVVGFAETAAFETHAFLFLLDANANVVTRTDLGTLAGYDSYAYDINDSGVVVGTSNAAAFRWQAGTMVDLNTMVPACTNWSLDIARAVNEGGQIVGSGLHEGQPRAFLMTPYLYGDMNCDGAINGLDISAFVDAMLDELGYEAQYDYCNRLLADVDGSGVVDMDDVGPFVALLMAQ